jgi:hypothetical protein
VFTEQAKLCPGGVCEVNDRKEIQKIGYAQTTVVAVFLVVIAFVGNHFLLPPSDTGGFPDHVAAIANQQQAGAAANDDCKVPDWAVSIGHADKWKLHHNCK